MQTLGLDSGVFIRSMATRGNLGGLARSTVDAVSILDAAGYGKIIIETVGVGQDEVEVVKAADVSVVVWCRGWVTIFRPSKPGLWRSAIFLLSTKPIARVLTPPKKELEALLSLATRDDGWLRPLLRL